MFEPPYDVVGCTGSGGNADLQNTVPALPGERTVRSRTQLLREKQQLLWLSDMPCGAVSAAHIIKFHRVGTVSAAGNDHQIRLFGKRVCIGLACGGGVAYCIEYEQIGMFRWKNLYTILP